MAEGKSCTDNIPSSANPRQELTFALALPGGLRTFADGMQHCFAATFIPAWKTALLLFCLFVALIVGSSPQLCAAGPNDGVEIDVAVSSPPCGLAGGNTIDLAISARNMSDVRQIKFELRLVPASAIASVSGDLGVTTEAEFFIAPGPPQVEGDLVDWGMAIFSDDGIEGDGELARLSFELAAEIDPATPVDIHLETVSLGPSFAERDTIRPVQAVALANYCDDKGQVLESGLFLRPIAKELGFSPTGTGRLADGSNGETSIEARFFVENRFRVGETISWYIDNRGPGPVYALSDGKAIPIEAGALQLIPTISDARGNAHLKLDSESATGARQTTVELRACAKAQSHCAEGQVAWLSPATAIMTPPQAPLPLELSLIPNYPNPFNAGTVLSFTMPSGSLRFAQLDVYNTTGQKVATPFASQAAPGHHSVLWDGRSSTGRPVASGLYIYRLRTNSAERSRTMLLVR